MPLARLGQTILFFVHIPKTGGSSIEDYLSEQGALALRVARSNDWGACSPQHIHAEIYHRMIPAGFYDHGFAILRDPQARLISEYRYRARQKRRKGEAPPAFDLWVGRQFARYGRNPYVLDNHIRPQVEFLRPGLTLFAYEAGLGPVFDWIDEVAGLGPTLGPTARPWKLRSDGDMPEVSDQTAARIREFYAADYEVWGGLNPS